MFVGVKATRIFYTIKKSYDSILWMYSFNLYIYLFVCLLILLWLLVKVMVGFGRVGGMKLCFTLQTSCQLCIWYVMLLRLQTFNKQIGQKKEKENHMDERCLKLPRTCNLLFYISDVFLKLSMFLCLQSVTESFLCVCAAAGWMFLPGGGEDKNHRQLVHGSLWPLTWPTGEQHNTSDHSCYSVIDY